MDQFHLMTVFVAVAEEEGFAAAARRLDLSPPAVTRGVSALEQRLGVKLFTRTTRYVRVTEAGQRYLEDSKKILADLEMANEAAAGINAAPSGRIVITAPVLFGQIYVMPIVAEYLNRYVDTQVDALFVDRVVNLIDEGVDVGIRIGALPDSSMRAIRVGQVRMVACASPEYINAYGIVQSPEELSKHSIIASVAGNRAISWKFENESSTRLKPIEQRLTVSSNQSAIEAAVRGLGITRLLSYQIAPYLETNELKILLENYEPKPLPVHIIHREGRFASKKVRAFIDMAADALRSNKNLN
ncbi:LysR substrate-binding domain-containing protein [Pleionea sediminis]|uniref:LysR substrate-binding domain-containing protein n=1 Tax=Pleionea sediminis TaxID=2569479 RepID=UPI00118613B0|nr:LysR substrate-binding domain-containing protein [Pleionea sediminis]